MSKFMAARLGWLCAALYLISLFFLVFQGGKTSLMLFVMLNALGLFLFLGRWSGIGQVQGVRTLAGGSGPAEFLLFQAGTRLKVKLGIQIPGFWPIPYVIVRERLTRVTGTESQDYELSVVPDYRRRGTILYETAPLRRGRYRFLRTHCSTRDIFGLFEHKGSFEQPFEIQVTPRTVALRDWRALRRSKSGVIQQKLATQWARETTQIDGVREYIHGDRMSRIHWNATARTGEWKSKEYEREALPRLVVVLDRCAASYRTVEGFELAVSAAASLLELADRKQMPAGFASAGAEQGWFGVGQSGSIRDEVMRHLIDVEADGQGTLGEALAEASGRFEPGAYMVIVSPLAEESIGMALKAMEGKRQVALHVLIAERTATEEEEKRYRQWQLMFLSKGWECCRISRLEELMDALEVGSA
ncbi:DUF58 domain-containing protein [Cohnella lubricantis]|uniref:DUF58 domain-containing protein n=1 Tax=Cohnella lubricantis TaxID=2163172 RepID=A0A841T6P1_9BACL|nr:DUF58 domain-containing protein [Cohnella lubricantis]MBB6675789.1 DUF58 domain-containing protein [Cohnella lubricantis]MBP2119864.1 uncharacterized protein (DUF58 family) [Cohnella lubricantis]